MKRNIISTIWLGKVFYVISPFPATLLCVIMKGYGYLFGFIHLIHDTHRDEVFIEKNGVVIMENGRQLHDYEELVAIAKELNYGKVTIIDYGDLK